MSWTVKTNVPDKYIEQWVLDNITDENVLLSLHPDKSAMGNDRNLFRIAVNYIYHERKRVLEYEISTICPEPHPLAASSLHYVPSAALVGLHPFVKECIEHHDQVYEIPTNAWRELEHG